MPTLPEQLSTREAILAWAASIAEPSEISQVPSRTLYTMYSAWCGTQGLRPQSISFFGRTMAKTYRRIAAGNTAYYALSFKPYTGT